MGGDIGVAGWVMSHGGDTVGCRLWGLWGHRIPMGGDIGVGGGGEIPLGVTWGSVEG